MPLLLGNYQKYDTAPALIAPCFKIRHNYTRPARFFSWQPKAGTGCEGGENIILLMKSFIATFIFLALALPTRAQESLVPLSIGEEWLQMANDIHRSHLVTREYILHPPQKPLPPSIMDTLTRYDWIRTDNYFYKTGGFNPDFGEIQRKYMFFRFDPDGIRNRLEGGRAFGDDPSLINYHSTNKPTPVKIVEHQAHTFIMMADGSFMRVVSFENGILLLDVFGDRCPLDQIDHPRRFRDVYLAVPRYF